MSDTVSTPPATPAEPQQGELPLAVVQGEPVTALPEDLYIPPDALEIFLEAFEGPLDLLLYLIKRQNLDILDIPVADITRQYMEYIDLMQDLRLDVAAEYLVMAAMLAEIKSRMLLPRQTEDELDEHDPRAELIRRLQEYERFKQAAEDLDGLPRLERDLFPARAEPPPLEKERPQPEVDLRDLLRVFAEVMRRAEMFSHHHIQREPLSVRERMSMVLDRVGPGEFTDFSSLFTPEEGRMGVVVTLLAILELLKASLIEMIQAEPFAPIYVKAASAAESEPEQAPEAAVAGS